MFDFLFFVTVFKISSVSSVDHVKIFSKLLRSFSKHGACALSKLFRKSANERSYFKRGSPTVRPSESSFWGSSDDNEIIFGVGRL